MVTLCASDMYRDLSAQYAKWRDSTLIAELVTADRYQRADILNELERRAKAKEERK